MCMTTEQVLQEIPLTLEEPQTWISIPLLNYMPVHELKDGTIVRFRGMIQDMQDPEIYFERYEVIDENGSKRVQEGKYRDCFLLHKNERVNYESDCNIRGERRTLVVISVPGLNSWASSYEEKSNRENISRSIPNSGVNVTTEVHSSTCNAMDIEEVDFEANTNDNVCRKETITSSILNKTGLESGYMLNSPIPERPGKTCMVNIYTDLDSYTLNSVVEFVGFLSINPTATADTMNDNELSSPFENSHELHAKTPPSSFVPRLHAVACRRLLHLNPLLDSRLTNKLDKTSGDLNMLSVQKDLRMLLTLCLFNDELAADYLLSHLISTVKDYETNKLQSGVLQLAPHTHLVLDETQMHEGKLEENGVKGIQSLAYLIKQQKLKYNFQYYEIDYNADIAVLVLSEGRSMLPSDFTLPLNDDKEAKQYIAETLKAAHHYLQPERLDKFRQFLTKAKTSEFAMNPEESEMIQADFVEMRKKNSSFSSDDLHALLVLSRLLAVARGKSLLDKDSWILAKEMEAERKQRLRQLQLK